jgi:putative phosphoribosyl transferase
VGSLDEAVLKLNREAQQHLRAASELVVVPGATHLFEEPGAMERVSEAAALWLTRHCSAREENG